MTSITRMFRQADPASRVRARIGLLAILVVSLILGVASREVLAANHNDPINGCYETSSRNLRYVDDGTCRNNEVALSWPSMSDFEALQVALANEAAERQAADAVLQAENAALARQIVEETAQREAADAALQEENAALVKQIEELQIVVAAETAARQESDATLHAALLDEIAARNSGDTQTLEDATTHINQSVAKEATERQSMRTEFFGTTQGIVEVIAFLMTADWDGAWESLLALAKARLPDFAYQALVGVGNMLGQTIGTITDRIDGLISTIQEILGWLFPDDPEGAQ